MEKLNSARWYLKFPTVFVALMVLIGLSANDALGCSCVPRLASGKTPDELQLERKKYYSDFDGMLLVGKVLSISLVKGSGLWEGKSERKVTVMVEKYWRKRPKGTIVIYTGLGNADCGVQFEPGKTFLFRPAFSSGILRSWLCDYVFEGDTSPDGETAKEIQGALGPPISFSKTKNP